MRNGVEEYKEWRRWRSLFFDQKIGCVFMAATFSSSDLLPCPSDNSDSWEPLMKPLFSF
jgi:hypothetical protein